MSSPSRTAPFPGRRLAERGYNVKRFTEMSDGGHFAAFEKPETFAQDVAAFFAGIGWIRRDTNERDTVILEGRHQTFKTQNLGETEMELDGKVTAVVAAVHPVWALPLFERFAQFATLLWFPSN